MFGGTGQFSFGASAPSNPFGATTTTTTAAAPATSGFLFGSSPAPTAGTAAPSGLNSTFTFGAPTASSTTAAPAATQPLTFGAGLQSSTAIRPFGSTTAFGSAATATTPSTGTTGFGGTSLFGATQPAAQPTSIFGATQSTFGAAQPAQPTGMFGASLGGATQGGTTVKFEAVAATDTMRTKNNTFQTINTKLQCICAMKEYVNKSLEELRMEDYQANRKFATATSMFGATSFPGTTPFSPAPFGASSTTFSAASTAPTTAGMFGATSTTTTTPFGAPAASTTPFSFSTSIAPTTSIFGTPAATTTTPFGTATSTTPATTSIFGAPQPATSIFGTTTTSSPFGAKPATTQSTFGFGTTTSTTPAFGFGTQPTASTSIFAQPTTTTPFGSVAPAATTSIFGTPTSTAAPAPAIMNPFGTQPTTTNIFGTATSAAAPAFGAATSTPAFTGFGVAAPTSTATSIFGAPATSTATATPIFGGFGSQTATAAPGQFSFSTTATSAAAPTMFGTPAASTTSSIFNPQPFTGFGLTQSQPAGATTATQSFGFSAPFGATTAFNAPVAAAQPQVQPIVPLAQQSFLAASLLNPFASRGKKDFNNINQIQPPTNLIVVSSSSSTTTTTVSTSTTAPITLPLQSNARKTSSARPLVDFRFKLQPVSSSPTTNTTNDEMKSPNPQSNTSSGQAKSPLTADFSEEEEVILMGRNKMSKLRLSNDFIDSSFQSESIRSLYPLRRLAELETLANMNNNTHILSTVQSAPLSTTSSTTIDTASVHVSSTTVHNEQTLHPSNNNRGMLPLHHSTPLIVHKQSSPPVSHPSSTLVQSQTSHPPPPPRSNTPPPLSSSSNNSFQRTKPTRSNSDARAYHLPKLTREDYYMKPSTAELKPLFDDKGQCFVKQFTVGHEKYGSVTFYGQVNVAGLDLDRIIEIDRHELTVYPDDSNKPPVGVELNIPARITLLGVYPTDRTTREEILDIERIKAMNYGEYLREVTKKFDGEFINYEVTDGSWTFKVQHFTRYGLDGSEDDFVVAKPPSQQQLQQQQQPSRPINTNFLDQTIALNDTYALSSPKSHAMDMEEKENTTTLIHQHSSQSNNLRFANQSLIGLRPNVVEQLAQSMFCDDDEDDFDGFQQANDRMITSTKIITSDNRSMPLIREPLIEKSTTVDHDKTQLTFNAPIKAIRERTYTKLPKNVANIRGKYFRTNFSHQLQYGSIDTLNETRILLQTPVKFNTNNVEELGHFLESYFVSCAQPIEGPGTLPRFQVRQDANVAQRFIKFYTEILEEKNMDDQSSIQSLTDYSLQVLDLCRLLWGPIEIPENIQIINQAYFEDQKRRQMLSNWLHQCILSQPRQQQQWIMQNCELLSRGLFHDCVKFAHDEGDLRLAALVHAASGSNTVRDVLRHCAHEDIVDVYTKDFQRTIAILSGEFIVKGHNLVDQNRTVYWQMALALHLWFAHSSSDSISTIVHDFETAYREHYWLEPITHYGNSKALDLRWKLLKLFTDDTYPIDNVFDVNSYTDNAFDYQLSWILYITLQSLGSRPLLIENDTCLHVNFAQQLEHLGHWQLSIFVLLHINDSQNREKMINEFLHRHVSSNIDLNEDEQILIDKYNIPLKLILSTKAQRAEYDKQWTNAVRLWIDAKQWRRAHDTYCYYVFHDTLLKGNYDLAKDVLDSLDHQRATIAHWNKRGGFVRQYIELLIIFDKLRHGQTSLSSRIHSNILSQVHRLCDQLTDVIADKYFKKISLIDISRRLLSLLNYFLICSNLPNLSNDNDENFARKLNLFHQSILSSVPCSLPLDLLLQQIDFKSRSHRP
ncbi:hypothetical protein I4U23_026674 [Adineta vaga]|nr:hypothetical protein I4U23_026674 [Adineta vaga]